MAKQYLDLAGLQTLVNGLKDGQLIVGRATADANGSAITTTYATKEEINALDFDETLTEATGGYQQVVVGFEQVDGKITSLDAAVLEDADIKFDAIAASADTVAIAGTNVQEAIENIGKALKASNQAQKEYKTVALTAAEIAALSDGANVKEAFKLQVKDGNGDWADVTGAEVIKVYKDKNLRSAAWVSSAQSMEFTYILADGNEEVVDVNMSDIILDAECENGVQNVGGKFSVKIDTATEKDNEGDAFLTVGADGVKIDGIKNEIAYEIGEAIDGLDAGISASTTNISMTITEVDGKLTGATLVADYATVTKTDSTSAADAPKTDAALTVSNGTKLATGSDIEKVAGFAADKVTEEKHRVDAKIAALGGDKTSDDAAVATVEVKTVAGEVNDVIVTTLSAGVNRTGDAKDARILTATTVTGAVTGSDITTIKGYVDDVVNDKTTDLAVSAEGDDYITAGVDADNNKKINVTADVQNVTASAGTRGTWTVTDAGVASLAGETAPSISGVEKSLMDGKQAIESVKTYVDAKVAVETAERAAKIEAAIKGLDVVEATVSATNVSFKYSETDGKVSISDLEVGYATDTRIAYGEGDGHSNTPTFTVTDATKIATGQMVADVAAYAKDLVDKLNADGLDTLDMANNSSDTVAGITVEVDQENGLISKPVVTVSDNTVTAGTATAHFNASAVGTDKANETENTYAATLTCTDANAVLKGNALVAIKSYVDAEVADLNTYITSIAATDIQALFNNVANV